MKKARTNTARTLNISRDNDRRDGGCFDGLIRVGLDALAHLEIDGAVFIAKGVVHAWQLSR